MITRGSSFAQKRQTALWADNEVEDPSYLTDQLITYIGNKRSLLAKISQSIHIVKRRLDKDRLRIFDVFAGSGVVSRFFKSHASLLVSNDFEDYAAVVARCYLRNRSEVNSRKLCDAVDWLNEEAQSRSFPGGFIEELYSPRDEKNIKESDRVFYTRDNARRLDNYRRLLGELPAETRNMLMGPLLSEASVHANTAGVFKGFYKDRKTGIGCFGGSNADALTRIRGKIELSVPILSRFECDIEVTQEDANVAARAVRDIDLAYLDPPYNQHPYGSNYFMLNLLVHYQRPNDVSRVSGIPIDWRRSGYNVKSQSMPLMDDLLRALDARFILISFNDEGFITPEEMERMLAKIGKVSRIEIKYNAFRGSRNLAHATRTLLSNCFSFNEPSSEVRREPKWRGRTSYAFSARAPLLTRPPKARSRKSLKRFGKSSRGCELSLARLWYFVTNAIGCCEIVAELRHTFPDTDFHYHFETSSIRPDGGILYMDALEPGPLTFPILISEVKNQGTNDLRKAEGLAKQAKGNAIERLGKNVIGLRAALIREGIFPFVCFGYGCDFTPDSSILDRVSTIAMFGHLNKTHLHDEAGGKFTRGSFYFREAKWTTEEMADVMADIAVRSVQYYFSKYGKDHFQKAS